MVTLGIIDNNEKHNSSPRWLQPQIPNAFPESKLSKGAASQGIYMSTGFE